MEKAMTDTRKRLHVAQAITIDCLEINTFSLIKLPMRWRVEINGIFSFFIESLDDLSFLNMEQDP